MVLFYEVTLDELSGKCGLADTCTVEGVEQDSNSNIG